MKKLLMMFALILSLASVNVNANALKLDKPTNLSVEQKDNKYEITFKSNLKENAKVEVDVSTNSKDWTSKDKKLIVKDILKDNDKNKIVVTTDELNSVLNNKTEKYSVRVRIANGNEKSDFSSPLTVGSIGIFKNSSKWSERELLEAQKLGLIPDKLKSDMKKKITREEFAEILIKVARKANIATSHVNTKIFDDTNNPYISNAYSLQYMNGTSANNFSPKAEITKQDVASAVYRMLNDGNKVTEKKSDIKDISKVSGYAKNAVNSLVSEKVFILDKNGNFNPLNKVTREEAVIILLRVYKL